jgi:hypothetical protein
MTHKKAPLIYDYILANIATFLPGIVATISFIISYLIFLPFITKLGLSIFDSCNFANGGGYNMCTNDGIYLTWVLSSVLSCLIAIFLTKAAYKQFNTKWKTPFNGLVLIFGVIFFWGIIGQIATIGIWGDERGRINNTIIAIASIVTPIVLILISYINFHKYRKWIGEKH